MLLIASILLTSCGVSAQENSAGENKAGPTGRETTESPTTDVADAVSSTAVAADTTTTGLGDADPVTTPVKVVPLASIAPSTETTHTGSTNGCAAGERLEDGDGDGWGECAVDSVAVNTWLAQAAAQASGLPNGTVCTYPATIVAGQISVINCPVGNLDGSEGTWSFVLASDSTLQSAVSYTETKPAPPTTAPPTLPPQTSPPQTSPPQTLPPQTTPPPPPANNGTDPHFGTCKEAKANGYGPYYSGQDVEYGWYRDADSDGIVCE